MSYAGACRNRFGITAVAREGHPRLLPERLPADPDPVLTATQLPPTLGMRT